MLRGGGVSDVVEEGVDDVVDIMEVDGIWLLWCFCSIGSITGACCGRGVELLVLSRNGLLGNNIKIQQAMICI